MTRRPAATATTTDADRRMSDLLDSVRSVFAAKGFDGASMQDLAQAAGMSAGNFYRYFPSKDAIIQAMVERNLAGVEEHFAAIINSDDPAAMLRRALDEHMTAQDCEKDAIWHEIVAAAGRRAEVGQVLVQLEEMITGYLVAVFARIAEVDRRTAERRFRPHANMLFTLLQSLKMRRRPEDGTEQSATLKLAHRLVDTILSEVAAARPARPRTQTLVQS